ncbi:hypothetical protein pclt_cds_734 [Pandoravirus celtis]|uniref:Uncharacterized protein n=1 Tax=Pandoravirus celtis TaxID=2568002 RepID=A0A4D6EHN7_9VIRU|nr:hypothetical protein pclt_cds_734 [Pandoravirus celtis]
MQSVVASRGAGLVCRQTPQSDGAGCVPLAVDHIDRAGPLSEGVAIRCLWLPWIASALDLVERAVLACCPGKDQVVEPHVVDTLLDALWRDVKAPTALILTTVTHAVAVGALDVLPTCAKALERYARPTASVWMRRGAPKSGFVVALPRGSASAPPCRHAIRH